MGSLHTDKNKSVIIVSRDSDYGIHFDNKSIINDFLNQEFKDRISNRKKVLFTNKLSFAFKDISTPAVTKQMETIELAIIDEENAETNKTKAASLNKFWYRFKDSLIDMFQEEDDKTLKE